MINLSNHLEKAAAFSSNFSVAFPLLLIISFVWIWIQSVLESTKYSVSYFTRNVGFMTLLGAFFLFAGKTHYFEEAVMAGPPPF